MPASWQGLQIGEKVRVNMTGCIWRESQVVTRDGVRRTGRLENATAFYLSVDKLVYLMDFLAEFLQAMGEPFGFQFVEVVHPDGQLHAKANEIFWATIGETAGEKGPKPEISEYDFERDGYFEAVFVVVAKPISA